MAFLPACSTAAISLDTCPDGSPGVSAVYYCQQSDIASVTVGSGIITTITMGTGKVFVAIEGDDQSTGFLEAMPELRFATKTNQELNIVIPGISAAIQKQLLAIKNCCKLVLAVVLNNGVTKIMGYDIDYALDTATYKNCQFVSFSFDSKTAADDDFAAFTGKATCLTTGLAPTFSGTLPV